ncbi:ABC transporter substrate-binding protein [Phycisphaerales bacterium AB-hyl4]|uniref:ABC transporter substrate-binding protein n=1 Tax=Natronomicrosphaera hydrolytica TaxID=3242702 RepID=A0ABV4U8J9_9BACT
MKDKVRAGELPPVEERLPADPIVVEPYARIGAYGGWARIAGWETFYFSHYEGPMRICPQGATVRLNLLERLVMSEDGKVFTLHLRPGVKWSDGHPHTADDYIFWFEHINRNWELSPLPREPFDAPGTRITKVDTYTVQYEFESPHFYFANDLAHSGHRFRVPAHFAKRYHVDFVESGDLKARAQRLGFINWMDYFSAVVEQGYRGSTVFNRPTLRSHQLVRRQQQNFYYERNPYYPKVDPQGQQLPYVDGITRILGLRPEIVTAQMVAGELTMAALAFDASSLPFLLRNEQRGGYTTYLWTEYLASALSISINQTFADPAVRDILADARFRRALSMAINRQEINEARYFGLGRPGPMFVLPTSKFYDEDTFRQAHGEYDPQAAKALLDEVGIVDRTGDGRRNRPGGGKLNLVLEQPGHHDPTVEMVLEQWREVGLDIHLRVVPGSFLRIRAESNQVHMGTGPGDRVGDTLFPNEPMWFLPFRQGRDMVTWGQWVRWFQTDGQEGQEPTSEAKDLMRWWNEMRSHPDRAERIKLGKRIMQSQAEHVWAIGTVGLTPQPVAVANHLHNVPKRGYWGWDTKLNYPYHPETHFMTTPSP